MSLGSWLVVATTWGAGRVRLADHAWAVVLVLQRLIGVATSRRVGAEMTFGPGTPGSARHTLGS